MATVKFSPALEARQFLSNVALLAVSVIGPDSGLQDTGAAAEGWTGAVLAGESEGARVDELEQAVANAAKATNQERNLNPIRGV